jgi:hypothetical protein
MYVDDGVSVRVLQINCRLHKGERDLNVSSLWQNDEGEMTDDMTMTRTRMILVPSS